MTQVTIVVLYNVKDVQAVKKYPKSVSAQQVHQPIALKGLASGSFVNSIGG